MKKYGLQLRVPPSQQKKPAARPPLPPPAGFRDDDDDDVEREISRQASKNKALKEVEEQHKKALEEDPSVFDYDGVYDEMKQKIVLPRAQDREERKADQRKFEQEIVYEKKIAKERSKEDHLYADKDKFVTSAYKKKLAEQAKWLEEARIRELKEEKDDVTKKSDLSDFYFNLRKNVAFGANDAGPRKSESHTDLMKPEKKNEKEMDAIKREQPLPSSNAPESSGATDSSRDETNSRENFESKDSRPTDNIHSDSTVQETSSTKQPAVDEPKPDHHKRGQDAVAAARERFLARKRAKVQL
ncbi:hypothetical protein COLO4_22657 [Corchorus olitorius]|uniref:Nuclear speckle splicing regulatory protein 1 N-terminal domain-containing protein n=1 Tax=Corchorus olitorius TaxID=93759 RepID=A0A1R3IKQ2_9ROSI|nr:hypothetical protein COLO4_22657 [Corchorus olitorius]